MKVNAKLFALVFLVLAAATLLMFFGDGGLLDDEFVKPTTGILQSMRGTATAEAAPASGLSHGRFSQHRSGQLLPNDPTIDGWMQARPYLMVLWAVLWTMVLRTNLRLLRAFRQ